MIAQWLFEIDTYRWSTQAITYDETSYTAKVIPDNFSGITMRWSIGQGLINPSDLSFSVENTAGTITRADLEGKFCTVRLITDGTECRAWKFKIKCTSCQEEAVAFVDTMNLGMQLPHFQWIDGSFGLP